VVMVIRVEAIECSKRKHNMMTITLLLLLLLLLQTLGGEGKR